MYFRPFPSIELSSDGSVIFSATSQFLLENSTPPLVIPSGLRISYTLHQLTATYAAFLEESRTRLSDATKP
jgi:hypothetical protein